MRQVSGFLPGPPVSSTSKTECHDITEILLKVVLSTINLKTPFKIKVCLVKINFHVFKVLECVDLSLFSSKFYTKLYKLMDLSVEGPLVFCEVSGSTQAFTIEWYTVEFVYSEQACNEIRLITK